MDLLQAVTVGAGKMAMAMAPAADEATTMRAACRTRYGSPETIELTDVVRPALTDDGVLVRVRAAALNRLDWYWLTGFASSRR